MPHLTLLGRLDEPRLNAALVRCDGEDGRAVEERVHEDRLWFVLRGRFDLRRSRARRAGDPATALLLGRDEPFCIRHPEGCGDLCLAVGGPVVEEAVGRGTRWARLDTGDFVRLRALAHQIERREALDAIALEEAMCRALDRDESPASARPHERELADATEHELAMRFDERLSLADLASARQVSVFSLCRAFRRARRAGVHRTLQRLRVRHAYSLLLDTDWTLARIAAECGFASHAHLTTLFTREVGTTPSAARTGGRLRAHRS